MRRVLVIAIGLLLASLWSLYRPWQSKISKSIGECVFTTVSNRPVSGFSKAKSRLVQQTSLVGFRLHDLRRTASTLMRPLGVDRLTVSRILNHAEGGVTAVYDRHTYDQEKRHALNAWSQKLQSIVDGTGENIVPLRTPRI